jgi:lactoylglutathione lyase
MNKHYQGLGHVAVYTKDLDESIAFYKRIGGALRQRAALSTPEGDKLLALVDFGGVTLELIQSPTPMPLTEGNVPHFAVYVDDLDAAAAAIRSAGVDTFLTPEKKVLPDLFGGLQNWFFTGPSGEQIELLQMLSKR